MTASLIGVPKEALDTPALLLDLDVLERNIAHMAAIARDSGLVLRPHAKTHKSPVIAKLQRDAGAIGLCCAKLAEAETMIAGGIEDILITTPIASREKIARLVAAARKARLRIVVDNAKNIDDLAAAAEAARLTLDLLVEIDVGQHRCGVPPGPAAADLADHIARHKRLRFRGLQGYHGKIQGLVDFPTRRTEISHALERLIETAEIVRGRGHEIDVLTGGGTGSAAVDGLLGGLDEIQPGSYVFMDASYRRIRWDDADTPTPFQPALSLLASVVSRPSSDRAILDIGWKSASCDSGVPEAMDFPGAVFEFAGDEHGLLTLPGTGGPGLGDKVELIPSHCDTTVNLHDTYTCLRGGRVEALWPIAARGKSQ